MSGAGLGWLGQMDRNAKGIRKKLAGEVAYALRFPDAFFPAKRERLARWAERQLRATAPTRNASVPAREATTEPEGAA